MLKTNFSDKEKILDILQQSKISAEWSLINSGNTCARARVNSYCTEAGVLGERLANVEFYLWLCELIQDFNNRADLLVEKLSELSKVIFSDNDCLVSFAGSDESFDAFWKTNPLCGRTNAGIQKLNIPAPTIKNEAFAVPNDVTYSAIGWDRRLLDKHFNGAWLVVARALTYGYLWNEVRVKGGAYGVGFRAARKGELNFSSYRDPHIDETVERFADATSWLKNLELPQEELDGLIIAVVASLDAPVKPRSLVKRQDEQFFSDYTPAERLAIREEALHATAQDLRTFAETVEAVIKKDARCVFGNSQIIDESKLDWNKLTLIG